MILAFSRRLFIAFFRNEKLPTLLFAHTEAFKYFQGCCHKLVYDNMTTVTIGRSNHKPIWNQNFLAFAKHYGFTPWACRPRHSDRKGKVERPFSYLEADFLRGSSFDSWDDLNTKALHWLNTVANKRVHSTTREVPDERFKAEKDLLIKLPEDNFPTYRREIRSVQLDGYISVDGSYYPVPGTRPKQVVVLHLYPDRVEVLGPTGKVAASYPVIGEHQRLPWPGELPHPGKKPALSRPEMENRFLAKFPEADPFLQGLKIRMKSFAPVHLAKIDRLSCHYTLEDIAIAIKRAMDYRNYSSQVIERILQKLRPDICTDILQMPVEGNPAALGALDDVEISTPEEYEYDTRPSDDEDIPQPA